MNDLTLDHLFQIVQIIAFIGSALLVVFKLGRATEKFENIGSSQAMEISLLRKEQTEMKNAIQAFQNVMVQVAVQNTRLDNQAERQNLIEKRLDDLAHGRGFIQAPINAS